MNGPAERTAVYRLYDIGGTLLYVGSSSRPDARAAQHAATKSWWPDVATTKLEWHDNRPSAQEAEAQAIRTEHPLHNGAQSPRGNEAPIVKDAPEGGGPITAIAVAEALRQEIRAGMYAPGSRLPSRVKLAAKYQISAEGAGLVLRMMRDEGLVTLEQGRGTYVCDLRPYAVTVTMSGPPGYTAAAWAQHKRRMSAAEKAEPAIADLVLAQAHGSWQWSMTVRSADPARAGLIGLSAVIRAAGEGWDLSLAAVSAAPL